MAALTPDQILHLVERLVSGNPDRAQQVRDALSRGLCTAAGTPLLLWEGTETYGEEPGHGFVLTERWGSAPDRDCGWWFPNEPAARAALQLAAVKHRRTVASNRLDLTERGCRISEMVVRPARGRGRR